MLLLPLLMCSLLYLTGIDGIIYKTCDGTFAGIKCKPGTRICINSATYCLDGDKCDECCDPDYSFNVINALCGDHENCAFPCDGYFLGGKCPDGKKCVTLDYNCIEIINPKPEKCGTNEEWADCTSACPAMCPDPCHPLPEFCTKQCNCAGCRCLPGFLRDRITGICVKQEYCPTFGETNEVFSKCDANKQIYCRTCEPGYVCAHPYKRDPCTGYCVLPQECPKCS